MSPSLVVLIGPPGAGKTVVGERVAARLDVPHVDVDAAVEAVFGQSRAEIFAGHGEAAFHEAEERASLAALGEPAVVSLGSAAVESEAVREGLAGRRVVWLRVSPLQAGRRLGLGALGMPTLVALRTQMDQRMREREPLYAAVATHRIDTDKAGVETVVEEVLHLLEGRQP